MKVFATPKPSGGKTKSNSLSATRSAPISTRFKGGTSLGTGRPTAGSLRSPKVKRYGRFYDEYGVGINVLRKNNNRIRQVKAQNDRDRKRGLPALPDFLFLPRR